MAPIRRIIIDTDPGIDDVLAILLALAASPEEVEVILLSITFGNAGVQCCVRNAVALFHVIEKELEWRRNRGQLEGFDSLKAFRPIIAVGAERPLEDQLLLADFFHGADGLAGVHSTVSALDVDHLIHQNCRLKGEKSTQHPHLTPDESWKTLFEMRPGSEATNPQASAFSTSSFVASKLAAHKEILRVLRENDPDTITIVAIGPLTNLALAAAEDLETFLRVKEVVVMGGAVQAKGNKTSASSVPANGLAACASWTDAPAAMPPTEKSTSATSMDGWIRRRAIA
ncbi:hypothetical protein GP486_006102 [Trichoglossum hirsutum]|uniref:Inosine/uridine-preferring nucleoside hydrolase domain-containing protein n=1 Tax=Trichoglossum hirsutum TaxID=265104 RepID=A0A9P8L7Y5_9PEZI|nr:hypothetical protein GP486_006102 [Trichoglossum hirsutum]